MTNNKMTVNKRVKIESASFIENMEASIPAAVKILSVTANCRLTGYEAMSGEIKAAVRITARIIYLNQEQKADSYEKISDASFTLPSSGLNPSDKIILAAKVTEISFSGAANAVIKATCELGGYFVSEGSLPLLECDESDIKCLNSMIKVESITALNDTPVQAAQSFEAKKPLSKILAYSSECWLNNTLPSAGQYQAEGEILTNVIALDADNELFSQTFMMPFAGEFADNRINAESELALDAFIKSTTITIESEGGSKLIIDVEAELKGTAVMTKDVSCIVDAYSLDKELNLSKNINILDTNICYRRVRERISGSASIEEGALKSIECVHSPMSGSITAGRNFRLSVEGVASTNVIYSTHDGKTGSTVIEAPYQVMITQDYQCDVELLPSVIIAGCNVKITGSSQIEATFDLIVTVRGVKKEEVILIEAIEYGESKETGNIAISLYIAQKGESLWNVAKELSASEDVLLRQNPNIKLPLQGGEKILLYRSLV